MFDKLKFNNLVISGKKDIQKAKVQVVRKIIQKIQKFKKIFERRPDDESSNIKLRKCMAVVESTKKLKHFDVITSILLLEKSPDKFITNSRSTPDQVAVAMLANNTIMKALSARISKELNLSESECQTWRKTLIEVSKQKIKKLRRKKRKQAFEAETPSIKKVKKTKTIKSDTLTNNLETAENVLKNNSEEIAANKIPSDILADNSEIAENILKNNSEEMASNKIPSIKKVKKTMNIKSDLLTNNSESKKKALKNNSEEIVSNKSIDNMIIGVKQNASKAKLRTLKSNADEKIDDFNTNFEVTAMKTDTSEAEKSIDKKTNAFDYNIKSFDYMSFPKKKTEVKLVKVVDPFFVTATGENLVTIVPVIEDNNKATENIFDFKNQPKEKSKLRSENQSSHPAWEAKQKHRNNVSFKSKRQNFHETTQKEETKHQPVADLHPSWAAKQKLKPTITAFQGKKIKFEE